MNRAIRPGLMYAIIVAALACRSASRGPATTGCTKDAQLAVENALGQPVEVTLYREDATNLVLGVANEGRSLLTLPPGTTRSVRVGGRTTDGRGGGTFDGTYSSNPRLHFAVIC